MIGQKIRKAGHVEVDADIARCEEGLNLRSEEERTIIGDRVVQRLHPESIAGEQELVLVPVPEREREHAAEMLRPTHTMNRADVEHRLRVARCRVLYSLPAERRAQCGVVVHFSIVDELKPPVGARHWLRTARHVDDAQPPVGQTHITIDEGARAIGAAMDHCVAHALERYGIDAPARSTRKGDPANPAHEPNDYRGR